MDDNKDEKIFDIDGYLGKKPEETTDEQPEKTPISTDQASAMGAEAVDVAKKTAVDPVQLRYKRNRTIVALVAGAIVLIAGALFIIDLVDKHNFKERSREAYAHTLESLETNIKTFDEAFTEYSYSVYDLKDAPSARDIYPTTEQMEEANHNCLRRFNIDTREFGLLAHRNKEPADYVEADQELAQISNNYIKAIGEVERCREDILEPIKSAFSIMYGKKRKNSLRTEDAAMSFESAGNGYSVAYPSLISYNGNRPIEAVIIRFALYSKNGNLIVGTEDSLVHKFDSSINIHDASNSVNSYGRQKTPLEKMLEFDPFLIKTDSGGLVRQNVDGAGKTKYENATVGVYSISGKYQIQANN